MRPKTYWHILKNSFSSSAYYLKIIKAPFWLSLRFFLLSMILLGISWATRINKRFIPNLQDQVLITLEQLEKNYPENLKITWTGKELEIIPAEILEISYPENFEIDSQFPTLLAYISPDKLEINQFKDRFEHESLIVITPKELFINNLQDSWTQAPLSELLPTDTATTPLTKESLPNYLDQTKAFFINLLSLTKQINYLAMPLLILLIMLWMGLIESIFLFLFFKLNQINLNFKKTYQLSLHLTVVAETINQVTAWIYPQIQLPMFTLSFWIILIYVFLTQKKNFLILKK